MELRDKLILLTGADGGIGSAIAKKLHQQGCQLILVGRDGDSLQKLNEALKNHHEVVAVDLTQEKDRQKLFDRATVLGGIDGLINNAGISEFTFAEQQNAGNLERLVSINLTAPMILCQMFIPQLKQKDEAVIFNMGSTFGSIGYPGFSAYVASKFGMRGYTETLRRELADSNLHIMYMAPRATKTPINSTAVNQMNEKLGNAMDDPQLVAEAVIHMLKKDKTSLYLGWPEKLFVRVNSLFPKIVDNALRGKLSVIRDFANQQVK